MTIRVVGAGVAGAVTALALRQLLPEIKVAVYERADAAAHTGWVTLGPAAMTALDVLGMAEPVVAVGFPIEQIVVVENGTQKVLARREPGHRYPSQRVWRRDLLTVLRAPLEQAGVLYRTAANAEDLHADPSTTLLIGADGARSAVRRSVIGDTRSLEHAGQSVVFGYTPHPLPPDELPYSVLHFWPEPKAVCGYTAHPNQGGFWFCRYDDTPERTVPEEFWRAAALRAPFRTLVDSSELAPPLTLWQLRPDGPWTGPRTVLLGDAAHPVSPASGRGASSAIEDGVILVRHLVHHGFDSGPTIFEQSRRARALYTYAPREYPVPPPQLASDFD